MSYTIGQDLGDGYRVVGITDGGNGPAVMIQREGILLPQRLMRSIYIKRVGTKFYAFYGDTKAMVPPAYIKPSKIKHDLWHQAGTLGHPVLAKAPHATKASA